MIKAIFFTNLFDIIADSVLASYRLSWMHLRAMLLVIPLIRLLPDATFRIISVSGVINVSLLVGREYLFFSICSLVARFECSGRLEFVCRTSWYDILLSTSDCVPLLFEVSASLRFGKTDVGLCLLPFPSGPDLLTN